MVFAMVEYSIRKFVDSMEVSVFSLVFVSSFIIHSSDFHLCIPTGDCVGLNSKYPNCPILLLTDIFHEPFYPHNEFPALG